MSSICCRHVTCTILLCTVISSFSIFKMAKWCLRVFEYWGCEVIECQAKVYWYIPIQKHPSELLDHRGQLGSGRPIGSAPSISRSGSRTSSVRALAAWKTSSMLMILKRAAWSVCTWFAKGFFQEKFVFKFMLTSTCSLLAFTEGSKHTVALKYVTICLQKALLKLNEKSILNFIPTFWRESLCCYEYVSVFPQVSHAQFLDVINRFGLKLEKAHLADFLARCSIQPTNKQVPYREFLHRFQVM